MSADLASCRQWFVISHQPPGVRQHQQCAEIMQEGGDNGPRRSEKTEARQYDDRHCPAEASDNVGFQRPATEPAEPDACAEPSQIAADQDDVRGGKRNIGAARA